MMPVRLKHAKRQCFQLGQSFTQRGHNPLHFYGISHSQQEQDSEEPHPQNAISHFYSNYEVCGVSFNFPLQFGVVSRTVLQVA